MKSQLLVRIGRALLVLLAFGLLQASAQAVWNYNLGGFNVGRANDQMECDYRHLPVDVFTLDGKHYIGMSIRQGDPVPRIYPPDSYIRVNGTPMFKISDDAYAYNQFCANLQTTHWYDYYPHTWKGWVGTHLLGLLLLLLAGVALALASWAGYGIYRFVMDGF